MTSSTLALCVALCGANPSSTGSPERVDLIEINHFHDDQGRPVFDQILFFDWSVADQRYQIRDWRLLKNAHQLPLKRAADGGYIANWSDFKSRDVLRQTHAKLVRETWTQYDPELVEREYLPEGRRRKLREIPALGSEPLESPGGTATGPAARTAAQPLRPLQNTVPR